MGPWPVEWSRNSREADWIRPRLSPFSCGIATSVVPGGFEAYARIFHPASRNHGPEEVPVRWSEVAAWSGLPLLPHSQFPDIVMPENLPAGPAPWDTGPENGTLYPPYAVALGDILLTHGEEPPPWWFCVWHGFGWETSVFVSAVFAGPDSEPTEVEVLPTRLRDPVPAEVRAGPTVELPGREYFLYSGRPLDALAFVDTQQQTANLWWPADHSWCVATEIDLHWTYVGGTSELVDAIVSDARLEALAVSPDVSNQRTFPD
jgi:hypothetical protein